MGHALGFSNNDVFQPTVGSAYPAGERSLTFTSETEREDNGKAMVVKNWMFLDEDFQVARAVSQQYNVNTFALIDSTNLLYAKISKEEFEDGIESTLDDINTVETLPFPMTRACLGSGKMCFFLYLISSLSKSIFLRNDYSLS